MISQFALAGITLAFISPLLVAQTVGSTHDLKYRTDGHAAFDQMGQAVSGAGDVNGDGFDDFLVGAPNEGINGKRFAGSASVYSGQNGSVLLRFEGLAKGDQLGISVSNAGDVNQDGIADLILGAPGTDLQGLNSGSAYVYSGANGAQLFRFDGSFPGDQFGSSVSSAGDVNADGFDDLLVGAPFANPTQSGTALVYSGATGAVLFQFNGLTFSDEFGFSVSGAGDVNQDGFDDLIIGDPLSSALGVDHGSAMVYSGASGTSLFQFHGDWSGESFGWSVSDAGDVNGDGFTDLMVGAPYDLFAGGATVIYSGATGIEMMRFDGVSESMFGSLFGVSVSSAGDVNGDGLADLIMGASQGYANGQTNSGSAFVYAFNPILEASAEAMSISAGGSIDYQIDFPNADAGQAFAVLLSGQGTGPSTFHGLEIPLSQDGLFARSVQGITPPQVSGFQGVLNAEAKATANINVTPGSLPISLIGRSVYLAVINQNLAFSSVAQRIDFQP